MCFTGIVYARTIGDTTHTFGVSGKLIMNALVMYDRQTDTLWSQFLSRGVRGPLAGTDLEIVPALQTTWEQWLQLHPDTLLLDKGRSYFPDTYEGYYRSGSAGIIGETNKDKRLPTKELVLGITLNGAAKAYPFPALAKEAVINDFFSRTPVVTTFEPISETGAVFERNLDGRTLSFDLLENTGDGLPLMKDRETETTWNALTGQAVSGPLEGMVLKRLPSHYSFWFAWSDFHPDTALYGADVPSG
ncbi:MAG: DUF3179 domain-containing protein [Chloroflexi bacterium]|nr:DUF3179 domain-containing protein [Chloroflexota bacterium]